MGIFNQHSNNQQPHQSFSRGLRGSPGVGFSLTSDGNYDMNHKKLKNVGEGVESSDAKTKHQLETTINSKINTSPSSNIFVKKDSPEVAADLNMKGFAIKNLKVTPGSDASATSRKYVDRELDTKAQGGLAAAFDLAASEGYMIARVKKSVNHSGIIHSMCQTSLPFLFRRHIGFTGTRKG